jgi:hypothetical protein
MLAFQGNENDNAIDRSVFYSSKFNITPNDNTPASTTPPFVVPTGLAAPTSVSEGSAVRFLRCSEIGSLATSALLAVATIFSFFV